MYEMEGPRPAQPPQPADFSASGCPACVRLPGLQLTDGPAATGLDTRPEDPVSRFPCLSEVSPESVSTFGGECVSTTWARVPQGFPTTFCRFLWLSTGPAAVIPCIRRLVHRSSTSRSTGCSSGRTPPAPWPAPGGPSRARGARLARGYRPSAYGCGECPDASQWIRRRGPSMYEMEGPRPVAQPSTPIAQLPVARLLSAADRTTDPNTRLGTSVSRALRAFRGLPRSSGVSPGSVSA
jgi:hypothetical protein